MSPSLAIVANNAAKTLEARSESISERVRRLQNEARGLAREHIMALQAALISVETLAAEISEGGEAYPPGVRDIARRLSENTQRPVFVTRGEDGMIVADRAEVVAVPGVQVLDQVDPVGAGDTAVAMLSAALASGCTPVAAAELANIAASITVRKLHMTGTATPAEVRP